MDLCNLLHHLVPRLSKATVFIGEVVPRCSTKRRTNHYPMTFNAFRIGTAVVMIMMMTIFVFLLCRVIRPVCFLLVFFLLLLVFWRCFESKHASCFLRIRSCETVRYSWFICWRMCDRIPFTEAPVSEQYWHTFLQRPPITCLFKFPTIRKLPPQPLQLRV